MVESGFLRSFNSLAEQIKKCFSSFFPDNAALQKEMFSGGLGAEELKEYLDKCNKALSSSDNAAVIVTCDQGLIHAPEEAVLHYLKGTAYSNMGQLLSAAESFSHAYEYSYNTKIYSDSLAKTYLALGDRAMAAQHYMDGVSYLSLAREYMPKSNANPDVKALQSKLLSAYSQQGQRDMAEGHFQDALNAFDEADNYTENTNASKEKKAELCMLRAECYKALGDNQTAGLLYTQRTRLLGGVLEEMSDRGISSDKIAVTEQEKAPLLLE